jgi:hypothetical protein
MIGDPAEAGITRAEDSPIDLLVRTTTGPVGQPARTSGSRP